MIETVNEPKRVIARKDHRCDYCGYKIRKGEIYNHAVYKYDYIYSWRSHIRCEDLSIELNMHEESIDGIITHEDFHEIVYEEYWHINNGVDKKTKFIDMLDLVCDHHLKE